MHSSIDGTSSHDPILRIITCRIHAQNTRARTHTRTYRYSNNLSANPVAFLINLKSSTQCHRNSIALRYRSQVNSASNVIVNVN